MSADIEQTNNPVTPATIAQHNARILGYLQRGQYINAEKQCDWLLSVLSLSAINQPSLRFEPTFYLGVALQFKGNVSDALKVFKDALSIKPQHIDVMQAIASCYEQLSEFDASLNMLLNAAQLSPMNAKILANLGAINEKLKKAESALDYYNQALAISPNNFTALLNKGALLGNLGFKLQALRHCELAYKTHPEVISTLYNLVDALLNVFKYQEALALADVGMARQPQHANLLFKKGLILSAMGHFDAAQICLANAQVLDSKVLDNAMPIVNRLGTHLQAYISPHTLYLDAQYEAQSKCYWNDRDRYVNAMQTLAVNPALKHLHFNYEFAFQGLSLALNGQQRLNISQNVADAVKEITWLMAPPVFEFKPKLQSGKLKVGYVSSDFRMHPTGILARQLFGLHDKNTFEIYCYSTYQDMVDDDVKLSVMQGSSFFKEVTGLTDIDIAQCINDDGIDILVDLNGYTAKSHTNIFCMRPAPIQVSYLAYINSMGADFIDYALLDNMICPPSLAHDWQEAVVRLPNSLYVYDNETPNSPILQTRRYFGLPDDAFVFCCLSSSYKIEPDIFIVWMHILKHVPHGVLWLLGGDELTEYHLHQAAIANGINESRIIFAKKLPHKEHLLRYQLANLFVDTYWCGAHTTALDALWQGLPVLCRIGEVSSARVAASFLQTLNMSELITTNFEAYANKAIEIANNPELLEKLKQTLAYEKEHSPLFNTKKTVKHIEKAYQLIWQNYCDGNPPIAIDVADNALQ